MRALAVLAAITMIHRVPALPHQDLAVRQGVNDLSNEKHIFHHLDRNQRTADRDRERMGRYNVGGSPESVVAKRLVERLEGTTRGGVLDSRFMRGPDYSQGGPAAPGGGGGGGGGGDSVTSASNTTPTQQADTANGHK